MQIESDGNGGSQQPSSSYSGQNLPLTRIMEQLEESLKTGGKVIVIVMPPQQGNETVIEGVRRVEIQSSEEYHSAGGKRDDSPKEKTSQLKFLNEVSDPVRTGTELKARNGEFVRVAFVDSETGDPVDRVPDSSAEVEIVVLEGEGNITCENFERRTIKIGEKKKPHFVKPFYIKLEGGVGILSGVKLGQDKDWTKKCKCRLGARIGQNLYAWTTPFEVIDNRQEPGKKHHPLKLSSKVWRLVQIGRGGKPCKRLTEINIETVSDFLFWFHVHPDGLKKLLLGDGGGHRKWEDVIEHAKTCTTDDGQRMYYHKSSNEPQMIVIYSAVGELKGVVEDSRFVRIDNLHADKKADAHKLLMSVLEMPAFVHRYETFFEDEASLLRQFPLTDPQNFGVDTPVDPGLENHGVLLEEHEINAGASEVETGEWSMRRSMTYSFEENGMQHLCTSISGTDHMEIPCDATSFQHDRTIHDDFASLVDGPQDIWGAAAPAWDLDVCIEDYGFPASLLPEGHEIHAGSSTNLFEVNDAGNCFISYTDNAEINVGGCGSASTGFSVGIGDENEQLRGACPISFRTRSEKGWILMVHVLKWRLSIKRIHKVRSTEHSLVVRRSPSKQEVKASRHLNNKKRIHKVHVGDTRKRAKL